MEMRRLVTLFVACFIAQASVRAQDGNGQGGAYLQQSQALIGRPLFFALGAPNVPNGQAILSGSSSLGPTTIAGYGTFWIGLNAPIVFHLPYTLDSNGQAIVPVFIANDPALLGAPPVFLQAAVVDPSLPFPSLSVSKTIRVQFDYERRYTATASPMGTARGFHSAQSLSRFDGDNRNAVLVAGGCTGDLLNPVSTASAELYRPVTHAFVPAPPMNDARAFHGCVRLQDGRVLVSGGVQTAGVVTGACEIYDPASNTWSPTGSMNWPRAAHAVTLLNDGRVLATGGVPDYMGAATYFHTRMTSIMNSAEVWTPATGQWTSLTGVMASPRAGHGQIVLPNGVVLISGGIATGTSTLVGPVIPVMTPTCEYFDPATATFSTGPTMTLSRAFHGISFVGAGTELLVTGGIVGNPNLGICEATPVCEKLTGLGWTLVASLPTPTSFHTQLRSPQTGEAIIAGGLISDFATNPTATALVYRHDGSAVVQSFSLGIHPERGQGVVRPRGGHSFTRIFDGSYVVAGGWDTGAGLTDAFTSCDF